MTSPDGCWVLLLRAVNLGATNKVPMASLRSLLCEAGHADVRTYLQSGNVVLRSPLDPDRLAASVRENLVRAFGVRTDVIVRSAQQLAAVAEANPFIDRADDPGRQLHVCFLAASSEPVGVEALRPAPPEAVDLRGQELYLWCPDGIGRSATFSRLGRALRTPSTTRNWRTVCHLAELAAAG